jgi:hypothetical protein
MEHPSPSIGVCNLDVHAISTHLAPNAAWRTGYSAPRSTATDRHGRPLLPCSAGPLHAARGRGERSAIALLGLVSNALAYRHGTLGGHLACGVGLCRSLVRSGLSRRIRASSSFSVSGSVVCSCRDSCFLATAEAPEGSENSDARLAVGESARIRGSDALGGVDDPEGPKSDQTNSRPIVEPTLYWPLTARSKPWWHDR